MIEYIVAIVTVGLNYTKSAINATNLIIKLSILLHLFWSHSVKSNRSKAKIIRIDNYLSIIRIRMIVDNLLNVKQNS
jgi:hypothetical protein